MRHDDLLEHIIDGRIGDLHMPLTKALDWLGDRFAGANVVYTPGNHDFWWTGATIATRSTT